MTSTTAPARALPKQPVLTVSLTTGSFDEQLDSILAMARDRCSAYVCCVNVHMAIEALEPAFSKVVNEADLATPDGVPMLHVLNIFHHAKQERVPGNDLMPALLARAATQGIGVFLYGGQPDTLRTISARAIQENEGIRIAGTHSPPFAPLERIDLDEEAERINSSGAGLVLVSLGCPKQERFMAAMKGRVNAVMVGVGGAFLLYAGLDKRAPKWMRDFSLEWLYRLWLEPGRLWKRYLVTNTRFVILYLKARITGQVDQRRMA
jgi:N-acetylglucosaminyldiphosphoundecaprenol N-acetyl-beta-D-mannosaminyltransferase